MRSFWINGLIMKKIYYLPEQHKTAYFDGRNKSKSPLNNFRKTPPRNVFEKNINKNGIPGVTFSTKISKKKQSLNYIMSGTPQKKLNYSHTNLQLDHFFNNTHRVENIEQLTTPPISNIYQEQYFSASLSKISEIRRKYYTTSINSQLDEVLNMIKQEKLKINEKMKILKRNNEYYTHKFEGRAAEALTKATNTDQLLDQGFEKIYNQQQVQVNEEQLEYKPVRGQSISISTQPNKNSKNIEKQKQYYIKLGSMLDQMKINHQQILPQLDSLQKTIINKQYKMLGDAEVIKIQRFFIKKLASRLPTK